VRGTPQPARARLCAAIAAVLLASGCASVGPSVRPHRHASAAVATRPPAPIAAPSSPAAAPSPTLSASAEVEPPDVSSARVTSSATVLHWGSFFGDQPGVNYDQSTTPAALTLPGLVIQVGTSNSTQYALLSNGSLYAWGLGNEGQLGDGLRHNSFAPVRVRFPPGVRIAWIPTDAMPYDTALAVDSQGNVWGWGGNGGGELCLGNTRSYGRPVELPLANVTSVAGASNHALYDADRTVYACGQNLAGVLGDGSTRNSSRPARVAGINGASVIQLVSSFANAGALLFGGAYYDWGYDGAGQLGDGSVGRSSDVPVRVPLPGPVTQVAQGGSIWNNGQTLVLLANNTTWAWGAGGAGQLGDGVRAAQPWPGQFRPPPGVTYQSLATGSATSYAVSTARDVYAWGVSFTGQVGDGLTRAAHAPVLIASGASSISSTANDVVIAEQ